MARDRLAALRAQRQVGAGQGAIEMQSVPSASQLAPVPPNGSHSQNTSSMPAFYDEVTSIQEEIAQFDANVNAIADLHARSLNALSEQDSATNTSQLVELTESTRALSNGLSKRIKALQVSAPGSSRQDAEIRKNRITLVHGKFVETLQRYQSVEQQYRQQYKDRVERQLKIVKPDATPEEVSAVVNDTQGGGNEIFRLAISSSNRYGDSRQAYREVQERHQDIQRIEATIEELAQLFSDMAVLVEQQTKQFDDIEATAAGVEADTNKGISEVDVAIKHARAARRKRWICFWITVVVILAAVGIGVGVYFSQNPPGSSSSSSGNSTSSG
ncbi:t-SNARE [Melanogaster broomeanus]|nr:t-SNARE [Melanogaster broomeanus]